jgi:hypothetical protein
VRNDQRTCLFVALKRSKVLVELALRPEPRPKARKPPKVRLARTRRGTKANGFRLRGQHFAVRAVRPDGIGSHPGEHNDEPREDRQVGVKAGPA